MRPGRGPEARSAALGPRTVAPAPLDFAERVGGASFGLRDRPSGQPALDEPRDIADVVRLDQHLVRAERQGSLTGLGPGVASHYDDGARGPTGVMRFEALQRLEAVAVPKMQVQKDEAGIEGGDHLLQVA